MNHFEWLPEPDVQMRLEDQYRRWFEQSYEVPVLCMRYTPPLLQFMQIIILYQV